MKVNNKLIFILTIIILILVIGWKINKDDSKNELNENLTETKEINNVESSNVIADVDANNEAKNDVVNEINENNVATQERIINITNDEFNEVINNSDKVIIVDFWATWCGPCAYMVPILEDVASERENIIIAKVNVDEEIELSNKYNITRIPTMLVFKNGEMKKELVGIMSKETILQYIDNIK